MQDPGTGQAFEVTSLINHMAPVVFIADCNLAQPRKSDMGLEVCAILIAKRGRDRCRG